MPLSAKTKYCSFFFIQSMFDATAWIKSKSQKARSKSQNILNRLFLLRGDEANNIKSKLLVGIKKWRLS